MSNVPTIGSEDIRTFRTTLKELYERVFSKAALLAIPQMAEMLEVPGSAFSKYQIFFSIVRQSVQMFDKYAPLQRMQRMHIVRDQNYQARVIPTFQDFISRKNMYFNYACPYCGTNVYNKKKDDGTWEKMGCPKCNTAMTDSWENTTPSAEIIVMPTAVTSISTQVTTPYNLPLKRYAYRQGLFYNMFYNTGTYYCSCVCKHPLVEEYDSNGFWTDNCAVYFLSEERSGSEYEMFERQVLVSTMEYLVNLKKNFTLSDSPIEIFGGLEEAISTEKEILQDWYNNSQRNHLMNLQ